jgi:hypothetical protein
MKFQIRKGQNSCDGTDMFYVYKWDGNLSRWAYCHGWTDEATARAAVERLRVPVAEVVLAEIGE